MTRNEKLDKINEWCNIELNKSYELIEKLSDIITKIEKDANRSYLSDEEVDKLLLKAGSHEN